MIVECCAPVWDLHYEKYTNIIKMEQRRAARFVLGQHHNTSSPTEMLEQLEQEYLKRHRTIPSQNFLMAINFPSIIIPSLSKT